MRKLFLFLALLFPVLMTPAWAATHTATNCEESGANSIGEVIDSAEKDTDATITVVWPSGTCTWTAAVQFDIPATASTVDVGGAGAANTVIIDAIASDTPAFIFVTSSNTSAVVRLHGFQIQGGDINGANKGGGQLYLGGYSQNLRVDHITIDQTTYTDIGTVTITMLVGDCLFGVIDNNTFKGPDMGAYHHRCASSFEGDEAWAAASGHGGAGFLFLEDNTLIPKGPTNACAGNDMYHGMKMVLRFNDLASCGGQTHPTGGSGRARGARAMEVYYNNFTINPFGAEAFNCNWFSSGTILIHNNSVEDTTCATFITMHSMRRNNNTYTQTATPNGWGYCGTSFNGTGSNWDENTSASTGYRCMDQPGNGQGDLLTGTFNATPSMGVLNDATGCDSSMACAWPRQVLEPVYSWSNPWACTGCTGASYLSETEGDAFTENINYFLEDATFDGTTGVGVGPIASRPATCTFDETNEVGVAYWATDEGEWNSNNPGADGKMYVCTADNTWTARYGDAGNSAGNDGATAGLPYTYPHPLRDEAAGGGGGGTGGGGLGRTRTRTR